MECITTVTYSLDMNGGLTKPFQGRRGIRQGDPMSPYLFVIAMEYVQRELAQLAKNRNIKFHPRCRKLGAMHICFADDLLMFCKADITSIRLLQQTFLKLIWTPGKCRKKLHLPSRYLGVPLASKNLSIIQCWPIVEKITQKINCWIAKLLSYAGRLQLIKSVLFEVQSYWAQIFLLPKKILKMIEAICRSFLWSGTTTITNKALVAWDRVCWPQAASGLNVINMYY
uniref:Uncharacterized protein LOC104228912 n=1 Tax=Nicotiana sylvestris TaxID=4096 RepID=A0A1U7WIJ7_NICSY|nr:PREDICTED: uncharacterized protein LOC104228912 [Nicotiana sylvestris]